MIKRWLQEGKITELEAQVAQLNDFINDLKDEHDRALAQLTAELEAAQKECKRLSDYSVELLNAIAELSHEKINLRMQLEEALKKPEETAVTPKPKRNSRKKTDAQE